MAVINTNSTAILTANALQRNERAMGQSMERLSTGLRINSAADDAAGLAISSKLTSQIRGLDQAARNANDAISMIQTADGAAIEIDNMLQRMREVAVQAASGTNTTADIANLDIEFAALADEIDRIVDATQWNGMSILDGDSGSSGEFTFQIGANDSQTLTVDFSDFNLAAGAATSATSAVAAVTGVAAIIAVDIVDLTKWVSGDIITIDGTAITLSSGNIADIDTFASALGAGLSGYSATGDTTTITLTADAVSAVTTTSIAVTTTSATATSTLSTTGVAAVAAVAAVASASAKVMASDLSGALSTATTSTITSTTASIIDTLDSAIAGVASQRANFGAALNRLEYTVDNLANVSQNTSASRSRVQDANYAVETTELARTQIIQQAGTAMLAQANQQAQSVLSLLKG